VSPPNSSTRTPWNTDRLKRADATDRETLGESPQLVHSHTLEPLPSDASLFFSEPIVGPSDEFVPPPWFLNEIKKICVTESPTPTKSPIRFELSQKAAEHNETVLERVGFDVGRLIQDSSSSTLGFGSEFRRISELESPLGKHPHFAQLANPQPTSPSGSHSGGHQTHQPGACSPSW
jgi:hypothetical protein